MEEQKFESETKLKELCKTYKLLCAALIIFRFKRHVTAVNENKNENPRGHCFYVCFVNRKVLTAPFPFSVSRAIVYILTRDGSNHYE